MMPLKLAGIGEELTIIRIAGLPVISSGDGNLIVNVKGSRIALGEDMAMKIFV